MIIKIAPSIVQVQTDGDWRTIATCETDQALGGALSATLNLLAGTGKTIRLVCGGIEMSRRTMARVPAPESPPPFPHEVYPHRGEVMPQHLGRTHVPDAGNKVPAPAAGGPPDAGSLAAGEPLTRAGEPSTGDAPAV